MQKKLYKTNGKFTVRFSHWRKKGTCFSNTADCAKKIRTQLRRTPWLSRIFLYTPQCPHMAPGILLVRLASSSKHAFRSIAPPAFLNAAKNAAPSKK